VTARPPRDDDFDIPALDLLSGLTSGLLGAILSAVAAPPRSTGPCYDTIKTPRDR
jgi:hypothetical protein